MADMTIKEIERFAELISKPLGAHKTQTEQWCIQAASALRQLLNAQKWREIDEQVKDGNPWLFYRDGEQFVARWYKNSREWGISAPVSEDEVRTYQSIGPKSFAGRIFFDGPSYVMPLPSPPQEKENGDV